MLTLSIGINIKWFFLMITRLLQSIKNFPCLWNIEDTLLLSVYPIIDVNLSRVDIAQVELLAILSRDYTGKPHADVRFLNTILHNSGTP